MKSSKNNKVKTFKWIGTSIVVPIIIAIITGSITAYIAYKMDKPKEYLIRDNPNMDNFKSEEYFPLVVGNTWLYERQFEYIDKNNKRVDLKDSVTCRVIESYGYDDFKLFILEGNPFYIPQMGEDANKQMYGYIVVSNKIIDVPMYKLEGIKKKFKNKETLYDDDLQNLNITFEFPLYDNQRYGEFSQLMRQDVKNITYVKKENSYKTKVKNNVSDCSTFKLNNLYNSGDAELSFVPYVGIIEYSYKHNGTPEKINFKLKEHKICNK